MGPVSENISCFLAKNFDVYDEDNRLYSSSDCFKETSFLCISDVVCKDIEHEIPEHDHGRVDNKW